MLAKQEADEPLRLVLAGGAAGILGGMFNPARYTGDCDVILVSDSAWQKVAAAAAEIAPRFDLPPKWLNCECRVFAWCLPLGWQDRSEFVNSFGPLEVYRLSRFDLLGAKLVASGDRTHDLVDLHDLKPTAAELDRLEEHLDRLQSEHLDNDPFQTPREIIEELRGAL